MKPASFDYRVAESWEAAADLLAEFGDDASILAGGQSLVPIMNFRLAQPGVLIDINPIPDGDYLRQDAGTVHIGALTRHFRFEAPGIEGAFGRLLPRVARHIAHLPIRMRGTFGGSLSHADPASEWCTLARTFDAVMIARSTRGDRRIAAGDFCHSALVTDLGDDEVLREIEFSVPGSGWRYGFSEFSRRAGDFAIVMAMVGIKTEDGVITDARVGVGGATEVPQRVGAAEAALLGCGPVSSVFDVAGLEASNALDGFLVDQQADAAMRRDLVRALVARALEDAVSEG